MYIAQYYTLPVEENGDGHTNGSGDKENDWFYSPSCREGYGWDAELEQCVELSGGTLPITDPLPGGPPPPTGTTPDGEPINVTDDLPTGGENGEEPPTTAPPASDTGPTTTELPSARTLGMMGAALALLVLLGGES